MYQQQNSAIRANVFLSELRNRADSSSNSIKERKQIKKFEFKVIGSLTKHELLAKKVDDDLILN